MYSLNVNNNDIYFKNVQLNELTEIYKWYNNIKEYGFATGVENPVSFQDILKEYYKVLSSPEEFFISLYNISNEMVGVIKGNFIEEKKIVWIKVFIIKTGFQKKGYGKKAVGLLKDYFIKKIKQKAYILPSIKEIAGLMLFGKNKALKRLKI